MGFGVAGDVADEFCIAQRIRRHVSLTLRKRGSYFRHAYRYDLDGKLLAVAGVAANAGDGMERFWFSSQWSILPPLHPLATFLHQNLGVDTGGGVGRQILGITH